MDYKAGICNFCGTGCGHLLKMKDGRVDGVFVSQNHPVSKGRLCVRGWHMHELLRTEERITSPMIRRNGVLEKVSLDEALGYIADKIGKDIKNPAEELAFLASPRSSNEDGYLLMKLARSVFKTNNISIDSESGHRNSINVMHRGTGMAGMLGSLEEIEKAEFILVVGTDITKQNPIVGSEIHKAALRGAQVVTICSRESQIAKLSKKFVQVKPGTKKIAIAAMAKAIIEDTLYDNDFIKKHTEGLDGFANALGALKDEDIPALTGVESEVIKAIARDLVKAKTAMVFFSSGISGLDEDTISYIYNLFLLAGKVGKEGCGVNPITGICNLQGSYDMGLAPDLMPGYQSLGDSAVIKKFNEAWKTDLNSKPGKGVYDLLRDSSSKLKALFIVDHDESIVRFSKEMKSLDLIVYFGAFENSFTDYAHVVIPTASYVEYDGTYTNTERRVQLSRQKTDADKNVQPAWKIYAALAGKKGASWNYASASDIMTEISLVTETYSGISYEKFTGLGGIKWPCNDKHPGGTARLDIAGMKGALKFVPVSGTYIVKKAQDQNPFLLMMGQGQHFWHQNNIMKRTFIPKREYNATLLLYPRGYVEICPEDAKKIEVRDKWPVKVVSAHGSMQVAVKVTGDVKPGTAYVPYFIQDMISEFLLEHKEIIDQGENAIIPVKIEKV
ncbi:MAG: hypothetical protein CVV44_20485 [Spirochaetae bacterium HGW-Spirochaetae-1]|nr:MAG: hypothetical protein CVV44_20485 [Spirochaetae bacterium HGW-Spirochaetae-1]